MKVRALTVYLSHQNDAHDSNSKFNGGKMHEGCKVYYTEFGGVDSPISA